MAFRTFIPESEYCGVVKRLQPLVRLGFPFSFHVSEFGSRYANFKVNKSCVKPLKWLV